MILKGNTIYLRMFEPEDYELTFQWHNDYEIQKQTCGPIRIVSRSIERNWATSKAENNRDDIYLAICSVESDKMIGFTSIGDFDYINRSCEWSGIVIGDKQAHNGYEYIETGVLVFGYVFDQLNMHRVTASVLEEHIGSKAGLLSLTMQVEGVFKDAVYKNGKYNDRCYLALLRDDYYRLREEGQYDTRAVMKRMVLISKCLMKERKGE